ncbi:MAG: cobalamin-dependent protein [Polyangiaceae bacterium]|nr:cobalamin-dependent protein [Polyangiaceae bacterium]
MNVLFINPNREQMPWPTIPVGASMVATATERAGHDVAFFDGTFSSNLAADTARAVRERAPDVIAVTIRNIDNCNFEAPEFFLDDIRDQVVRAARRAAPDAKIVIGGSAVNVSPSDIYDHLEADYALVGEGEEAFPELLRALGAGRGVLGVPGLLANETKSPTLLPVLDTGRLLKNEPIGGRARVADLERSVRSEAFRWVDVAKYGSRGGPYPIQTKRGCALRCSYCVYNNIEGHAYRLRRPSDVADEIAEAIEHGVRSFDFVDSTFNLPLSHARALCDELASRAFGVRLSTMGLNPAGVTPELVGMMKRAGFDNVMCTPESASEVTLQSLQKGFGKPAIERAARALREAGMPTYWFFMLGAPGETLDTVRETLEFCEQHIPADHMVLFSTGIRVYAGTPLERSCKDSGWFDESDPLFLPSWYLSPKLDLNELYALLVRAAERHPNWMTNAETILSPTAALMMKRAFRLVGWRGPFWQHLPTVFRWAARSGVRSRGLADVARRLAKIEDIAHHR